MSGLTPMKPASILFVQLQREAGSMESNLRQRNYFNKHRAWCISSWSQQDDEVPCLYPVQLSCTCHIHVLDPITPASIASSEQSIPGSDRQSVTLRLHTQAEYKSDWKTQSSVSTLCVHTFSQQAAVWTNLFPHICCVTEETTTIERKLRHKDTNHISCKYEKGVRFLIKY